MTATAGTRAAKTKKRFPILEGVLPIDRPRLPTEVIAGLTLAALAMPEVMGYAKIAEMPVVLGLYTLVLPLAAFAIFGSSRHLVVGADSATAAVLATGLAGIAAAGAPGSASWVAMGSLAALMCAVFMIVGQDHPARVHRELPVAQRPDRLPDRRRDPGRDGSGRRDVRGERRQRHDPREVRQHAPCHRRRRDERPDPRRVDRGSGHDRRPGAGQQEDSRCAHRGGRCHRPELCLRFRRPWDHDRRHRPRRPAADRPAGHHRGRAGRAT